MKDVSEIFSQFLKSVVKESIREELESLELGSGSGHGEYLSTKQAAEYLGVSPSFIYQRTRLNEIPYYPKGRKNFFKKSDLDEWMNSGKVKIKSDFSDNPFHSK